MQNNFQRLNSLSNASEGKKFEILVQTFFNEHYSLDLKAKIKVPIGTLCKSLRKLKEFDLGKFDEIVIECKSHNWTVTQNAPSAKMSTWNEAMYLFQLVPSCYRKMFVVEKFYSSNKNTTLAKYYIKTHGHLIPNDVEIWEFDRSINSAIKLDH